MNIVSDAQKTYHRRNRMQEEYSRARDLLALEQSKGVSRVDDARVWETLEQLIDECVNTVYAADDEIAHCGSATLAILRERPEVGLKLAYSKLHTWPFQDVPMSWRRLYEEATLWKAAQELRKLRHQYKAQGLSRNTEVESTARPCKKPRFSSKHFPDTPTNKAPDRGNARDSWVREIAEVLDKGIALSGAPWRRNVFEMIFEILLTECRPEAISVPQRFHLANAPRLSTLCPVARAKETIPFEDFQEHLSRSGGPLIIPSATVDWPAMDKWNDPTYLMRLTLNGRRLVPVEIGRSYTDEDWGQNFMPFGEYMHDYLLAPHPERVGYLAQYDLFAQIPKLRDDFTIPDYCYTTPPSARRPARNASEAKALELEQLDEPLLNAWLGPKGTQSPLHTDPYHNILCQVVGYKYIRLYSPEATQNLYPRDTDEAGIDMSNTSRIDIDVARKLYDMRLACSLTGDRFLNLDQCSDDSEKTLSSERHAFESRFPHFQDAAYQECILGPGDCLYLPLGWWHFVKSVSTSFSVSFWWN